MSAQQGLHLVVRRRIAASPERLFEAWTTPEQLLSWWGPQPVRCSRADVDLRVGGAYRLDNRLPDGEIITIHGQFLVVQPPHTLVYSWNVGYESKVAEHVTVRFEAHGPQTEVVVVHERIPTQAKHDDHMHGWLGCFDGLVRHLCPT